MSGTKGNRVTPELKEQILKEVKETGNAALVARTHGLVYQTVMSWIRGEREKPKRLKKKTDQANEVRLQKLELENRILKELLKKTNQAWLSDSSLQESSSPSPNPFRGF